MAPVPNRLAGAATLSIDGVNYMISEIAYQPTVIARETVKGQDSVHGYKEMPTQGMISATFRDAYNVTVADFNAMTGVTIQCALANGKLIVGTGMWTVDAQEVKTEEATFEVKFEGRSVTEN